MLEISRCCAIALLGCSALLGCAHFSPDAVTPQAAMRSFEARTLDSPDLKRYVHAHSDERGGKAATVWDLESLTLAAYYYSPELDVARARSAVAEAAIVTASQPLNPTLQVPLSITRNPKPGESPYTLGLGLEIPIETAGKRGYRTAQARQLSLASKFDVGMVAWQVRARLRAQLLDLFMGRRRIRLLAQQMRIREQIAQMLDKRLALGAASGPEAQQAHAALLLERLARDQAELQVQDALASVAATIGLPLASIQAADLRLAAFGASAAGLPARPVRALALNNRADVQAALAAYEASQAGLQLEIANQYPTLRIGPGYTFDAGAQKFALSLSGIELPLFNQNQGPIAEAMARRREAAARFNAVQAHAIGLTDRAYENFKTAVDALRGFDGLLVVQRRQLAAARKTFRLGSSDRLALALAELDEISAELAHERALARQQRAVGELEDAMQRPLVEPADPTR